MRNAFFLLALLPALTLLLAAAQIFTAPLAAVQLENGGYELFCGVDNAVTIVAQQNRPVSLDQLSVTNGRIEGAEGRFRIRPDSTGSVGITIKVKNETMTTRLYAKPIVPVARLGMKWAQNAVLGNGEFKAQNGIIAVVECCGFDARCKTVSYSVIRITKDNRAFRAENKGASFTDAVRPLIDAARPGDIYWFRDILAQCPGAKSPQHLDDIAVEIR